VLLEELTRDLFNRYPNAEIRVPVASTLTVDSVRSCLRDSRLQLVEGDSRATLSWADVAAVASGTATLETAIIGTPFCLFYKMSGFSTWVIQNIIRYKRFFGMPNLLHQREVVREFLHAEATAPHVFREICQLIDDKDYREKVTRDVASSRLLLGNPGASQRAAQHVLETLRTSVGVEAIHVHCPA
jgi:lipid-A-disaccharide synthase